MVGAPDWNALWQARLRSLPEERIDIGLHLDLTEHPLRWPARGLTHLMAGALLGQLDAAALRVEVRAQLDAFEQALGRAPAFVDGHRHVHQLPVVRGVLLEELARRHAGRPRPWLRSTRAAGMRLSMNARDWSRLLKAHTIVLLGSRGFDASALDLGFAQNHALLGVYDFQGGAPRYRCLLGGWLHAASHSDLLMCHPGLEGNADDPIANARAAEYEALADTAFDGMLRDAGVALAPMSRILAGIHRDRHPG